MMQILHRRGVAAYVKFVKTLFGRREHVPMLQLCCPVIINEDQASGHPVTLMAV
jgi:hypothetical protein